MDAHFAVLTETWLHEKHIFELTQELSKGSGLGLLTKNRPPCENGVSYGGAGFIWRESAGSFKEVPFKSKNEVLVVAGSIKGHRRKMVIIGCYLPPGYNRERGRQALNFIEDVVVNMKRRYVDPYLIIAGDFNQWRVEGSLSDFADIKEVEVGPTRGVRSIDRIFTNVSRSVEESGTLRPLETEASQEGEISASVTTAWLTAGLFWRGVRLLAGKLTNIGTIMRPLSRNSGNGWCSMTGVPSCRPDVRIRRPKLTRGP